LQVQVAVTRADFVAGSRVLTPWWQRFGLAVAKIVMVISLAAVIIAAASTTIGVIAVFFLVAAFAPLSAVWGRARSRRLGAAIRAASGTVTVDSNGLRLERPGSVQRVGWELVVGVQSARRHIS
jgi:hypothetical protein